MGRGVSALRVAGRPRNGLTPGGVRALLHADLPVSMAAEQGVQLQFIEVDTVDPDFAPIS